MTEQNKDETVEEIVIPVVEERVVVGKRTFEGRTVQVTSRPVVRSQTISEPVIQERVSVERVPVGQVIDAVPDIREEGDLTVIPVVEEQIVVTRQLVLTEEIHLRRIRTEQMEEHTVELLGTEIEISE